MGDRFRLITKRLVLAGLLLGCTLAPGGAQTSFTYTIVESQRVGLATERREISRVVVHSETLPSEANMRAVAQAAWEGGNQGWDEYTVFLYLDGMNPHYYAYGIAEFSRAGLNSFVVNANALYGTKWEQ